MDKQLGLEYPKIKRVQFLKDNCEKVDEIGYMKQFSTEEIATMKDTLSEVAIEINDIEIEKKEAMKEFKDRRSPLSDRKSNLLKFIKEKAEFVKEECYKFIDQDNKMVGYYNSEGQLIESRPMRPDEGQLTIKMGMTGTDK